MVCGIYKIEHKDSGRLYIGSASDVGDHFARKNALNLISNTKSLVEGTIQRIAA